MLRVGEHGPTSLTNDDRETTEGIGEVDGLEVANLDEERGLAVNFANTHTNYAAVIHVPADKRLLDVRKAVHGALLFVAYSTPAYDLARVTPTHYGKD